MKSLSLLIVLFVFPWACSADVCINSNYFTSGASLSEGLIASDVNLVRQAIVSQDIVVLKGEALHGDDLEGSTLSDDISITSLDDGLGAKLSMGSGNMEFDKTVVAGMENYVEIKYSHGPGWSTSGYFNSRASAAERMIAENGKYGGTILATEIDAYSFGSGDVEADAPGGLDHDIWLDYRGKPCSIEADIMAADKRSGEIPVHYSWTAFTSSSPEMGSAGFNIRADDGNRCVDVFVRGVSSALSDKIMDPDTIDPISDPKIRVSKDFHIVYEMT